MQITGRTRITGLFGYPVEHTLSPVMQNAAFSHLNFNCCYLPFSVSPSALREAVGAIRALSMLGVNLTIPHKETVIPFLDSVDAEALSVGAVNTIVNREGHLAGHNTDGKGFMRSLGEQDINPAGKRVLVIGAGGSSRAIGFYLAREAASLSLFNRNRDKAAALADHLSEGGRTVSVLASLQRMTEYDIIINATPLGLRDSDPLPLDADALNSSQIVCDLIYRKTPLLIKAQAKGCRTLEGMGMLLWQGALAFELWTGMLPPVEVMRTALLNQTTM
jgi:shikimate dehydrogenase